MGTVMAWPSSGQCTYYQMSEAYSKTRVNLYVVGLNYDKVLESSSQGMYTLYNIQTSFSTINDVKGVSV